MLVFIEGGPEMFANQAFETADLLNHEVFKEHLQEYRWTNRTITSKLYPEKSAQVWRHVSVAAEEDAPGISPIPSAAENKNSLASDSTVREAGDDSPLPMRSETAPERAARVSTEQALEGFRSAFGTAQQVQEARASVALDGETVVVGAPRTVQPAPQEESPRYEGPHPDQLDSHAVAYSGPRPEDYTGEPVQVAEGDDGDLPSGEQLFLARKRLKLTVQQVADEVGLKRSRVDAIEKGTAVRGDVAGDLRKVHEFLSRSLNGEPDGPTLGPDASVPGGEVEPPRE